jgi:transposase-like protein
MSDNEQTEERQEVDGGQRGRPGRRSVQDRKDAVLQLLAGKATVDQLARQYGVRPETVEGWRADALAGVEEALRLGVQLAKVRGHRWLDGRATATGMSRIGG